jgi:uncharacterized protein
VGLNPVAIAEFRFYEELNDFLLPERRKRAFAYACARRATVKNAVESMGVPHTEIELILVNGRSVDFSYIIGDGDRISVYPQFESLDVGPLLRVRSHPLRVVRFIADAHLGGLAKYLRILGFDTLYRNDFQDEEIARIAAAERRVVLTRDRDLLKHRTITHGCYLRAVKPREQLAELLKRLDLFGLVTPFTRCSRCNGLLEPTDKHAALARIPASLVRFYDRFWACAGCDRIYWAGSHYRRLQEVIDDALHSQRAPAENAAS